MRSGGEAAFASWLYRIVANAAYQNIRSRRRGRTEVSLNEALPVFDDRGRHVGPVED
jgi:DNA-directed RNA polymerase specialized sigma24 family protein